ncbi:hypothetical protein HMPREF9709_01775 [Helcococcus kunzii ATCC 51366]|uniref:Uncharacterized protein n=1 Tax=Helcococcus kunzii ATCC 51366 TaxID=883114 RepID=H3NR14_9FIRM|nr:hypothetical protein HMPREF9709_01775 [Helcococcus kunzii ATCC 51366]
MKIDFEKSENIEINISSFLYIYPKINPTIIVKLTPIRNTTSR